MVNLAMIIIQIVVMDVAVIVKFSKISSAHKEIQVSVKLTSTSILISKS